jgi:hypothetical protein
VNWSRLSFKSTGYNKIGRGGGDRTKSDVEDAQVMILLNEKNDKNTEFTQVRYTPSDSA